jgi:hypothetical protein
MEQIDEARLRANRLLDVRRERPNDVLAREVYADQADHVGRLLATYHQEQDKKALRTDKEILVDLLQRMIRRPGQEFPYALVPRDDGDIDLKILDEQPSGALKLGAIIEFMFDDEDGDSLVDVDVRPPEEDAL